MKYISGLIIVIVLLAGCREPESEPESKSVTLLPIKLAEFARFVDSTGYKTDAERYGWSIVQQDVYNFITVENAIWSLPDGKTPATNPELPVTQVSYNDAKAYCDWAGVRLPTYDEYWEMVKSDKRKMATENMYPISPVDEVNIVGNVWEITEPTEGEQIRLAGGSIFCSPTSCYGTERSRMLEVDKETGNIHIGFSVVMEEGK
jgi:hypothetical protein